MDVSVSRHMGLFAVARLAERHGVRVRLRPRTSHGLTALIWLPDSVTEREASLYGARSRTLAARADFASREAPAGLGMPMGPVPEARPANHHRDVIVPEPAVTGPRETVPVAATAATADWFRRRTAAAAGNGNGSAADDGWAVGKHAAQVIAEPVHGNLTSAGLPTRIPQANLIPGSAGGGRAAGSGGTSRPGSGPEAQAPITPRSPRSPDVARNRLSGFQRGVRRAKGLAPDDGEGADR
jgi:hypothetical protein